MGAFRWLTTAGTGPIELICFPHAGSGPVTYGRLARQVTSAFSVVRLPGRHGDCCAPVASIRQASREIAAEIVGAPRGERLALWGHSFGAVLAWETAAEMAAAGAAPDAVVLTGRDAPGWPSEDRHRWPDHALVEFLRGQGGTPEEVLADDEMRTLVLAHLRADLALLADHVPGDHGPIAVPLVVVGGTEDPSTSRAGLDGWVALSSANSVVREVPGGHFFPWEGDDVVTHLRSALAHAGA